MNQKDVDSVLEMLHMRDLDAARARIEALSLLVRSEKDRGSLLALSGIFTSMFRGKEGTMRTWEREKVERASKSISSSQMADDIDRGYSEVLLAYSRMVEPTKSEA